MPNEQVHSLVTSESIIQMLCALQFVVRQMLQNGRKKEIRLYTIWASTREHLSLGVTNNKGTDKGTDQPAHLRRLISTFVIHFLEKYHI